MLLVYLLQKMLFEKVNFFKKIWTTQKISPNTINGKFIFPEVRILSLEQLMLFFVW